MKLVTTLITSLFLFAIPSAQAQQSTAAPAPAASAAQAIRVTRSIAQKAPAENFTGSVRISTRFQGDAPACAGGATVSFEPGARTAWHTHPLGQTLIVTAGTGRVQNWGGSSKEMRRGDVVWIPPGVKHWHGAAPDTAMTHVAIVESLNGKAVDWLEKVSDAQYGAAPSAARGAIKMSKEPSAAQKLIDDFSPKMVQLTDDVLFGDIWERADLSKRDRSLITVAALIAGGNTEQLPGHLTRAKENGVTETEIVEVITHLAFYSGWPKAMSAIGVAKKVFEK